MLSTELTATFYALMGVSVASAMLTGSTLQWIWVNGRWNSQYNIIVTIAAIASLIQTVTCYVNALMAPDHNMWFMIYILINWVFMTHTSVMLVSKKLSLTYLKAEQERIWHRLLLINVGMFPLSLFVCVYWTTAHNFDSPLFSKIALVVEPLQIALWGVIEFCLSGAFIVQMWKYNWTTVERKAIYVLIGVGCCDALAVLLNIFLGDLESTSVKGFVYCLRIRLEVAVLGQMVDYVRKRRNPTTSSTMSKQTATKQHTHEEPLKKSSAGGNPNALGSSKKVGFQEPDGGSSKKVGFQVAEGSGLPKTRQPAPDSFAMMTLTQMIADEDDHTDENESEDHVEVGQPGTRERAPDSFAFMTLTQMIPDEDDITEQPGDDDDVEAGGRTMLPPIESLGSNLEDGMTAPYTTSGSEGSGSNHDKEPIYDV